MPKIRLREGAASAPPISLGHTHLEASGAASGHDTPSSCHGPAELVAPQQSSAHGPCAAGPGRGQGGLNPGPGAGTDGDGWISSPSWKEGPGPAVAVVVGPALSSPVMWRGPFPAHHVLSFRILAPKGHQPQTLLASV